MFGNTNKPFGFNQSSTSFGGGNTFGANATTSSFGAKTGGTPGFGTSGTFGNTSGGAGGSTGLFGSSTNTNTGGLFGGSSNTSFGQSSTQSTGFSFGNTNQGNSGGLFGNTPSQNSSSIFGTPTTSSAFGAKTTGFGTTTQSSTGLFGGGGNTGGTSLFNSGGNTSTTGTGIFGSSTGGFGGSTAGQPGTAVAKFKAPTSTDSMMRNGQQQTVNTRHQCISAMKEYESKSMEELRAEDYSVNRKGPQQGASTGGGGLFGGTQTQNSSTGFNFGGQNKTSGFGFGSTNTTTSTSGGLFGSTQQQNTSGGMFGNTSKSLFGGGTTTTTASTGFAFGQPTTGGTSLFGNNQQNKSLFGASTAQTQSGGLFGANTATSTTGGFGNTGGGFGQQNTQTGSLFGNKPTGFGQTTTGTTSLGFGQSSQTGGLFGNKPATSTGTGFNFGNTSSSTGFGTTNTGGLFSGNKPTGFGTPNTGSSFLGGNTGLSTGGTNLFGNQNKPLTGLGTGSFGGTGLNLGTQNTSGGLGGLGQNTLQVNNNVAQTDQQIQQQLLAIGNSPYGDSPLFTSLSKRSTDSSEKLKPTNPVAQKAVLNSSYKVSPRPTVRIKPKPLQSLINGKAQLFEGLDDEDSTFGNTFVPKRSIKELVMKPNPNNSQLGDSFSDTGSTVQNGSFSKLDFSKTQRMGLNEQKENEQLGSSISGTPDSSAIKSVSTPLVTVKTNDHSGDTSFSNQRLDDTLEDFKNPSRTREGQDPDQSVIKTPVRRVVYDDTFRENQENEIQQPPHPTGIVLRRPDYFTIPPLDELTQMIDDKGDCFVDNFTVVRNGYGSVLFYGWTNVKDLNLDDIVHFRRKEITVYPNDKTKPSEGEELNKKAQITLDCVWPTDKSTHMPIQDPERLIKMNYQSKVESATNRIGAKFLDYRPESGSWVFEVSHFSKYQWPGEENDDENVDPEKLKAMEQQKKEEIEKQKLKALPEKDTGKEPLKEIKEAEAQEHDKDEDDDIMKEKMPEDEDMDAVSEIEDIDKYGEMLPATHRLATSLGVKAHDVQVMKASFFGDEEEMEVAEPKQYTGPFRGLGGVSSPAPASPVVKVKESLDWSLNNGTLSPAMRPAYLSQSKTASPRSKLHTKFGQQQITPKEKSMKVPPTPEEIIIPSGMEEEKPRKVVGSRIERQIPPLSESVMALCNEATIMDAALFMGRSCRVGWGPNMTLVHCGRPVSENSEDTEEGDHQKTFSLLPTMEPKSKQKLTQTPYQVVIEKAQMASFVRERIADPTLQKMTITPLETQLKHSECSLDSGCPLFVPKPGVGALHEYAKYSFQDRENSGFHPDAEHAKHRSLVWDLCVALWGNLPQYDEEDDVDTTSYTHHMARREAFSKWLSSSASTTIKKEVQESKYRGQNHLQAVISYISGRQISQACVAAQEAGDHRLALLISQVIGPSVPRDMLAKQLANWREQKADQFIQEDRLRVYALLAGVMVWRVSDEATINVCANLDWKRCLAIHLWYLCTPSATIPEALRQYDSAFMGTDTCGRYAVQPYPPYLEQDEGVDKYQERDGPWDTCYHLLRLYSDRTHSLVSTLSTVTTTPYHLDFRLSWHLSQVLESLDYRNLSEYEMCLLCTNYSAQLEAMGLWQWAVFVALHIVDDIRREALLKEILGRNITLSKSNTYLAMEEFIVEKLHVPTDWIHAAKATRAHYEKKTHEEAWHLLKAEKWNESHQVVLQHIAAESIINENYNYLRRYLNELAPIERSSTIYDWTNAGKVFLDYVVMVQTLEEIKQQSGLEAYELEKLQEEVTSLSNRLCNLRCRNSIDRLAQSDMAKKTAALMRTMLSLRNIASGIDVTAPLPTRLLAPHIGRLPMPEDYALQELRELTRSHMLEMTISH